MKKLILLSAIACLSVPGAGAQKSGYSFDLLGFDHFYHYEYNHHRGHGYRYDRSYDGLMGWLEIGFNGFRTTASSYDMYSVDGGSGPGRFMDLDMGRSIHLALNLARFRVAFTSDRTLGLSMGVGLAIDNFAFETPSGYEKFAGMIYPVYADPSLKKAKLNTFALHIPMALEVNPVGDFFISAGGYADLLLGSHLKSKSPKEKVKNPYTNFLQAGVTARIGFRQAYVFANYGLVDMFKTDRGPELTPYSFGIGVGF